MKTPFHLLLATTLLSVAAANPPQLLAQSENLQKYVTKDFVAGLVAKPGRLLNSKQAELMLDGAANTVEFDAKMQELKEGIGIDPRLTDEIVMLLDRRTILQMAGLPDEAPNAREADRPMVGRAQQKNNLKQILLAFHNFHDTYLYFVDDDGHDADNKGKLSWRVHLLPFLGQQALYAKFKLDEPWDSEHNKALMPEMPGIFLTNGVKDKGKTSVHVLTSEGTLFGGDKPTRIRDITDGTSNTILAVVAGSEKAAAWTKPGGLELKEGAPKNTLGDFGSELTVALADGSVHSLPAATDGDTFRKLATLAGGEVVDMSVIRRGGAKTNRLPSWIVRSTKDINQDAVLAAIKPMGDPIDVQIPGGRIKTLGDYAISFPDRKTLVAAPAELLPQMLAAAAPADTALSKALAAAGDTNDFTLVVDLRKIAALKNAMAGNIPMGGVVKSIEEIQVSFDITGSGKHIQAVVAKMKDAASANLASGLLTGMLQVQRMQIMNLNNVANAPEMQKLGEPLTALFGKTIVKAEGTNVTYATPKPEDTTAFIKELLPLVRHMQTIRQERVQRYAIKQIGLAFHNYHDVYGALPRHGSDADERHKGLSWRVHLLPFVEHAELYNRFKLDESWDSEHNKKLIASMPDIFSIPGVDKPGHTTFHVFTGEGTPFGDGETKTRIRDFRDGTSKTFLAVKAGPDTAAIWTKPGGLEFTGDNGLKILGKIGATFDALMCDGSARKVSREIDEELLHNLIQHQDGNNVGAF